MQTSAFKFLPFLLATLVVVGAVAFASQKFVSPTPFVTVTKNPIVIPTPAGILGVNSVEESSRSLENTRDDTGQPQRLSNTSTKTTTVCTPVYGMANSCAEHAVVDTGLETGAFYNLAALSYFGGLAAFIKAKRA
ncbi:MAG: hypothetical protein AAB973_03060 [Patescibacteria group bacterium]